MPQFEIKDTKSGNVTLVRSRNIDRAVRDYFDITDDVEISFQDFQSLEGWERIDLEGKSIGEIRPFHRMKFRRD